MIINIFNKIRKEEDVKENIVSEDYTNTIDIDKLKKYAVDNGIEYLKIRAKEPITKMLQEYLTFNYENIEEDKKDYYISKVIDNMFGYGI